MRDGAKEQPLAAKGLWSAMLNSASSNKKLPEKHIVVLGGDLQSQQDFLSTLESEVPEQLRERQKTKPIVSYGQSLGYTYLDVLDADHEARLSIWFVADRTASSTSVLAALFPVTRIAHTLVIILLEWREPWRWMHQLCEWVKLLRAATAQLDSVAKQALETLTREWQKDERGPQSVDLVENHVSVPLGSGEWDEALGLPICVVCQNANMMDMLEQRHRWRDEEFDFILQFLRTVLMKHGASLVYTTSGCPNSMPTLVQAMLDIRSPMKRQILKHNVIDRDKILVPHHWDSWGKIRVMREGFDVEGVSSGWGIDIDGPPNDKNVLPSEVLADEAEDMEQQSSHAVGTYEKRISDPDAQQSCVTRPAIEVEAPTMQAFLASQQDHVARLAAEDEAMPGTTSASNPGPSSQAVTSQDRANDHIGPIQVNMGGIQVDADDMVRKLQMQSRASINDAATPVKHRAVPPEEGGDSRPGEGSTKISTPDMKAQNEALQSFFSGLMKRGATNSPRGTPKTGKETSK